MHIAFLNRGREAFPGGDCIALDATMGALRRRGHVADEIGWVAEKLVNYDICHMMHSNFSWSWGNYSAIIQAQRPYVLTPIYYPGPLLSGVTKEQIIEIMQAAKRVLPFSNAEVDAIQRDLGDLDIPHTVIPNATDTMFHGEVLKNAPYDVLCVSARGDSDKNVAMVRRIMKHLHDRHFFLATGKPRDDLAAAYHFSKVFVNASGSERMSLTIGEALCAGCRVLATDQNWGNSYYPGLVTFDPNDELRLELLIRWALTSPDWDYGPNAAARCISWDWVAEKLEAVYTEVLNG